MSENIIEAARKYFNVSQNEARSIRKYIFITIAHGDVTQSEMVEICKTLPSFEKIFARWHRYACAQTAEEMRSYFVKALSYIEAGAGQAVIMRLCHESPLIDAKIIEAHICELWNHLNDSHNVSHCSEIWRCSLHRPTRCQCTYGTFG